MIVYVPRLQDIGGRQILLLRRTCDIVWRRDAEISPFVFVEEPAEYGGGVEVGPGVWGLVVGLNAGREGGNTST